MERLSKGGDYYFISIPYYKVCATHDEHFESDDERFDAGNYFLDKRAAQICFNKIDSAHGERLREIARERKNTVGAFTQKCISLALSMGVGDAATKKKPTPKKIVDELVEANDSRKKRLDALSDESHVIYESIREIIRKSRKTL